MDFFDLREPVSAWTHGAWLLLSLPAAYFLWCQGRGDRPKQLALLVFGFSLAFCFAASALYHGARKGAAALDVLDRLDHIGIYLLIAGTYTPVAWVLLRGRMRSAILGLAWGIAVLGGIEIWFCGVLSPIASTLVYLAMGWGALFCYFEIARALSYRALRPMLVGGVLYSVGAVFHLLRWPVLWPGVFQAHELFHVFVMGGSLAHFWFMLRVVAPYAGAVPVTRPAVRRPWLVTRGVLSAPDGAVSR
jgi:hemolysin III